MQNKVLAILLTLPAVLAGVYLLPGERQPPSENSLTGQRLFPELEQKLNDINRIRVEHNGGVYTVVKKGDQWQLPDKGGYPVLFERVKPLLLGIALLEKVEPKTDKPENYTRLSVQEPSKDSGNTRLNLYASGSDAIASLIVGKIRHGLISGDRDGIYVRISGKSGSWLVAGNLDLPQAEVDWVDRQIIHIKPKAVHRITIRQPDGGRLVVEKAYRGAPGFAVINMPEDVEPKKPSEVNALARALAGLKMEDIRVRPPAGPPETEAVTAVFETWDGLQVRVTSVEQKHRVWAWFELAGTTATAADGLQTRAAGWIYQLPSSRATKLRAKLSNLSNTDSGLSLQ